MKYIKHFEDIEQNRPKIGDYLYANIEPDFNLDEEQKEDAKTRIFKILKEKFQDPWYVYTIQAVPEPNRKDYKPWYLFDENILCFAPTIEELERKCKKTMDELKLKYQTLKYNL